VFKVLCAALLAYVAVLFLVASRGTVALNTVIPHIQLSSAYIALLVAVLRTTISPYCSSGQAMHRVEEMQEEDLGGERAVPLRQRGRRERKSKQLMSRLDVFTGMAFSNVVMFAIITANSGNSWAHAPRNDRLAGTGRGSASAPSPASLVRPCSRSASSARACSPSGARRRRLGSDGRPDRQRSGLFNSLRKAPVFYGLVAVGTIGGMALSLLGVNPIKLLILVAVITA